MKLEAEKMDLKHKLPDKVHVKYLNQAANYAGLVALILGFDVSLDHKIRKRGFAYERGYPTVLIRLLTIFFFTWVWFTTE